LILTGDIIAWGRDSSHEGNINFRYLLYIVASC
jgi:hypothetical protein